MTSISGDGRAAIEKTISPVGGFLGNSNIDDSCLEEIFEVPKILQWISIRNMTKICLQFPDEYLKYSTKVANAIESALEGVKTYMLADSTYGSCCVDEKTSQHVPDADALIHFGQSCLSRCSGRIPVLYIFTKPKFDLSKLKTLYTENFANDEKVVLMYDVIYEDLVDNLYEDLEKTHKFVLKSTLVLPHKQGSNPANGIIKHRRSIPVSSKEELENYKMFFIGSRSLPNLLLCMPNHTFRVYDPALNTEDSLYNQTSTINRLLRKRNYFIEKVKDAQRVGILVGTLSVENYLDIIERLKTILRQVGKKFYVVSIGEINPCKLANFMDIDCFVFVGCPEIVNYYISDESKGQFYQPILTPFDIELAFCDSETTDEKAAAGQQYITDWSFLIEKGLPKVNQAQDDMSLLTGELRSSVLSDSGRSIINWQGLDENDQLLNDVTVLHQGRSGIASAYTDEPSLS